jgi:alpha-mannosidase
MEVADRPPHVKTCINLDARAYEFMAEKFPEVARRLKKYLAEGKVELIGGTYGQPMGTMFSGESNIRQIVYGRETIRKALDYEMVTFLEEEEFSHPQIPQIVAGAGYRYASLAQVDTWGNAGIPRLELNSFRWQGKDGATIPSTPKNSLFGYSPDLKQLASSPGFQKLQSLGKPLIFTWEEFGWEPPDEPAYLKTPEKYRKFAEESPVEFVTLKEYLDKYGANPKERVYLNMDAWNKLLTWGLGGDQLRIMDRKVEGSLLAGERFDAIAHSLGMTTQAEALTEGWKNLLASQSHDVGLCEYSRWQGDRMAPLDRIEDYHNFTWGDIGYNHLDAAKKQGQAVLDMSLAHIAERIGSATGKQGERTVTVFNPSAWERTDTAFSGNIYLLAENVKGIAVKDSSGRVVPSQIIKSESDGRGNLTVASVAFLAERVPAVGYDTYYLEVSPTEAPAAASSLRVNEQQLELENDYLKVKLGPTHGAIISLIDKRTGRQLLDGEKSPFPVFRGTPNRDYCLSSAFIRGKYHKGDLEIPPLFDSSKSVAEFETAEKGAPSSGQVDWGVISKSSIRCTEKGPLRAAIRTRHNWPLLKFETHVTLHAGKPWVEVTSRVLAEIPPSPDALDSNNRFPVEIKNGYWLSFAPNFDLTSVWRDFPLGVEPTTRSAFHALTFVDFVGKDAGLLVLHAGTQYFRREGEGVFSNLVMREWESYFTGEYGWPRYSEFRHALFPHRGELTNVDRLRATEAFTQKLITIVGQPQNGALPSRKSFLTIRPENAHLLAFRQKNRSAIEFRVVEVEGREAPATVEFGVAIGGAVETNLLGNKVADITRSGNQISFRMQPWRVRTFELT